MYYFIVEGWSMFPTVLPGAVIGLNTAEKNIVSGEMYGIWYEHEGASIKYLFAQPGKFIIKADNPKYPESEITVEELEFNDRFIIGRLRYLSQIYK
jgi:phage repressor protein C with HTH and peptisase S24 domain